jgi:trehalose 6-phosphate synthase
MSRVPASASSDEGTIVIVANRGPHDFVRENGRWVAKLATGGFAHMIVPLARQPNVAWFCCVSELPGTEAERDALYTTAKDQTDPDLNVVPVPLPAALFHDYYGEISNEVLWILQHGLVGHVGFTALDERRHRAWASYLEASRRMADAIVATELPVRAFLIEDYHLYPLAALLRHAYPETPSLHFIHIPFADPATFKLLPKEWRDTILRGLLSADVVGLQTAADVRSFLACCQELLGSTVDYDRQVVIMPARTVRVRAFPASIDPDGLRAFQSSAEVATTRQRLARETRAQNIVRIERVDPTRNQLLGVAAFERFLELNAEFRTSVRFIMVLIPSRTDATIYRSYHDELLAAVERVNARFGADCGFAPIHLISSNDYADAVALLETADVLFLNVRRNGMDLLAKEWAILLQRPGVFVVSDTTGISEETRDTALQISPLDLEGAAHALAVALRMPAPERTARLERFRAAIAKWTLRDWLNAQLEQLGLPPLPKLRTEAAREAAPRQVRNEAERELMVRNRQGIHARPAAAFVRCARQFECSIEIVKEGQSYSAKSILSVLTANLNRGTTFLLRSRGIDATEAMAQLGELLERLYKEDP